jgi:hypothetical protein
MPSRFPPIAQDRPALVESESHNDTEHLSVRHMATKEGEACDEKPTQSSARILEEFTERPQAVRSFQDSHQELFIAAIPGHRFCAANSFATL